LSHFTTAQGMMTSVMQYYRCAYRYVMFMVSQRNDVAGCSACTAVSLHGNW